MVQLARSGHGTPEERRKERKSGGKEEGSLAPYSFVYRVWDRLQA